MKCGKRSLGFLLLCFLCSPVSGQSFEDTRVYQVTGKELNALSKDLQIAKIELEKQKQELLRLSNLLASSQKESARLEAWLKTSQQKEAEQTKRLVTLNESFSKYRNEIKKGEDEALVWGLVLGAGSVLLLNMMLSGGR